MTNTNCTCSFAVTHSCHLAYARSWWSVVTLTTVGYGDVYPITVGGKVFTFFVLIIGVGVVTVPAGLVATALSKAREIQEEEEKNK